MRLQRIAVYRATRILSWVLPVVIFVFVGIAAWSYWSRLRDAQPSVSASDELPPDVAVVTKDVKYVVSVSGRDQFEVAAREMQVSKDNRSLLKGVEVLIYAQKAGDPDRRIHGDQCTHDKQTEQVNCHHNVSVELEPGTIARTEQLFYEPKSGLISSSVRTALDRTGEMTGHAGKMDYLVNTGLMRLTDGFVIDLTQGGGMQGGSGVFQYKENWATVTEGVELTSTNGHVHGGRGRAELAPGTYRAKKITVEEGAGAESPSFVVDSEWLQADLSDTGNIEHVLGRGNVQAEHKPVRENTAANGGDDPLSGKLHGPEVEAWLEGGRLTLVEARQHPDFVGASGTLRASEKIRIEPAGSKSGSLQTEGISNFTGDSMTIDGRNFLISVKDNEQIFNAALRATLKSAGLTTVADKTEAHLDTKTKMLTTMQQAGNVTFEEDESGRKGAAGKLTIRNAGDLVDLEGDKPWFKDAQGTLNARKITFDRSSESFTGDGSIRMTSDGSSGKPVIVEAGHVEGTESRVDYTRNVQMFPGDGGKVEADHLIAYPKENRFEAAGHVHSRTSELDVTSQTLDVKDSGENSQVAHYTGDVRAEKKDKDGILELRGQDLKVHLKNGEKGGQLDTIVATGKVEMTQGIQNGRGDRFEYNFATRESLLVGTNASEAEVHERGTEQFVRGCSILMKADGSKSAKPCTDRSVTSSIKVNKK
jgi:LPS export ABC transporter protein LptC